MESKKGFLKILLREEKDTLKFWGTLMKNKIGVLQVLIGRLGSVSPQSGQLANIESITAVVIGGISLFGGRGSIAGSLFGALIVGVFSLGLRLLGADVQWTYLLIGILIIAAVTVDQYIRQASS